MSDCIFCKLANGEIETRVVYEDDMVCAFEDANPQAPVHVLIVPKKHYRDISDGVPSETISRVFEAANKVAKLKEIDQKGYRLITNKGTDAGQSVFHWHVHLLGGKTFDEGLV